MINIHFTNFLSVEIFFTHPLVDTITLDVSTYVVYGLPTHFSMIPIFINDLSTQINYVQYMKNDTPNKCSFYLKMNLIFAYVL